MSSFSVLPSWEDLPLPHQAPFAHHLLEETASLELNGGALRLELLVGGSKAISVADLLLGERILHHTRLTLQLASVAADKIAVSRGTQLHEGGGNDAPLTLPGRASS